MLNRPTAIPHIVGHGDASVYYSHVILLIWNILICTTEVMSVNQSPAPLHMWVTGTWYTQPRDVYR